MAADRGVGRESGRDSPSVVVVLAPGVPARAELAELAEYADPILVSSPEEYVAAVERSHAMLVWDLATPWVREFGTGRVEWIHTNSIGVDAVATEAVARSGVVVTNTRGLFEQPMAEFVLAGILFHVKRFRRSVEHQRAEIWDQAPAGLLRDRHAVIVGAGGVGARTALLLRAVGMKATVVGRSARANGGTVDGLPIGPVRSSEELGALLGTADDLILAAPLTEATRGLIGAEELARLRPGAHLVNVGRGPLVREGALVEALRSGALGAATLDVFDEEPLAAGHPLWGFENVLISPHQSASFDGWQRAAVGLFLDNLRSWQSGSELRNLVDTRSFISGRA